MAGSKSIWGKNSLYVTVSEKDDGAVEFAGQDLANGGEYEYWHTVDAADVPKIVSALGGKDGDDVLTLIAENAETIVTTGEGRWLKSLGISPRFYSWS